MMLGKDDVVVIVFSDFNFHKKFIKNDQLC